MDDGKPLQFRKKMVESPFQFGGRVRVRSTPLTVAAGVADRVGMIFGQTTPSQTGVDVLGDSTDDFAVNVSFDDPKKVLWFGEGLLELVEAAPEMEVTVVDGVLHVDFKDGEYEG
jgi:hypothetical protein